MHPAPWRSFPASLASSWAYRRELASTAPVLAPSLVAGEPAGRRRGGRAAARHSFGAVRCDSSLVAAPGDARLRLWAAGRTGAAPPSAHRAGSAALAQFLLAVYGGYFGGAVGIMMMATWSLLSTLDVKVMNPPKTLLVAPPTPSRCSASSSRAKCGGRRRSSPLGSRGARRICRSPSRAASRPDGSGVASSCSPRR